MSFCSWPCLFSMTWASSGVSLAPWYLSWYLRANLNTMLANIQWYEPMQILDFFNLDAWCNPRCLTIWGRISGFLQNEILLYFRSGWSCSHSLAFNQFNTDHVHTFRCSCVIDIHEGRIIISVQLSMLICLEPLFGMLLEPLADWFNASALKSIPDCNCFHLFKKDDIVM